MTDALPRTLQTRRLVLRQWTVADDEPFAALNADPEVMRHFPAPLTRAESDALAARIREHIEREGWGLWAVEHAGRFIGFTGLSRATFEAPFTPAVEVGWRLARDAWGHGFATEAAHAALEYGFTELGLPEIVSFTAVSNARSQAVMRRLGMTHTPSDDFGHPRVPVTSPLHAHVLYRITPQTTPSAASE